MEVEKEDMEKEGRLITECHMTIILKSSEITDSNRPRSRVLAVYVAKTTAPCL